MLDLVLHASLIKFYILHCYGFVDDIHPYEV